MKKKLIFGLIFLLVAFGFLEAQYHFFLRANRYWSNTGIFSTDGRIQSIGASNTLRAAYSSSRYGDIICDSAGGFTSSTRIQFLERAVGVAKKGRGEGTYLFANGLAIGGFDDNNPTLPGDSQGIKMEFIWGSDVSLRTGSGKMAHGLDIKMTMDQPWDFSSNDRNAVVRGARIQGWSQGDVGGKVMGAYICARAEESGTGAVAIEGIIGGTDDGPGIVAIEARTELGSADTVTTPAVVGVLIYHNSKTGSALVGHYKAIQIEQPLLPSQSSGSKYGIWFGDDHNTAYPYDFAFGFSSDLNLDQVAHYNASIDQIGTYATDVDGWIRVQIDNQTLYIYCFNTKPTQS